MSSLVLLRSGTVFKRGWRPRFKWRLEEASLLENRIDECEDAQVLDVLWDDHGASTQELFADCPVSQSHQRLSTW